MEERISVILVNYNGREYNDKCITSILNSTISHRIQIIVVDNASTDGSLESLRENWQSKGVIQILALGENYGFSKANNEGIRWALQQGIEYFLLLNNDTEIEPDTIECMLRYHKKTKGIVVPKVLYADKQNTVWCAGGSFSAFIQKPVQRGLNQIDEGRFGKSGECQFANGCAFLLSKEIVDKTGLLDERFFLYYEDVEYSLRAAKCGVKIWYCSDALVYHKVNGSTRGNESPANAYYISRNWLLCNSIHFCREGGMSGKYFLFLLCFFVNRFMWMIIWLLQGKKDMCVAQIKGIRAFYEKKWGKYDYLLENREERHG